MQKKVYGNILFCYPNDQKPNLIDFLHANGYSNFTTTYEDIDQHTLVNFEFDQDFPSKVTFKKYIDPILKKFKSIDKKISSLGVRNPSNSCSKKIRYL